MSVAEVGQSITNLVGHATPIDAIVAGLLL